MTTEHIYPSGASSLDVRTCEECGESAHIDDMKRCAGCECWSHPACADDACENENGEWFDAKDCRDPAPTECLKDSERTAL